MMKTFLTKCAVYGALFLAPVVDDAHAYSAFETGNDIYKMCVAAETESNQDIKYMRLSECRGFITGVSDQMEMMRDWTGKSGCVGEGVSKGQLLAVVVKYLNNFPEKRHLAGNFIVMTAIEAAFCP